MGIAGGHGPYALGRRAGSGTLASFAGPPLDQEVGMPPVLRVTAIAAAALLGPSLAAASAASVVIPQRGFPSPDAAIAHMARGVAAGDASAAIDAFAIDDAAAGFDFDRYVRRLVAIDPQTPSPSDSALYRELNRAMLLGRAATQLRSFAYGFLTRSPPATFRRSVDPRKLAGLRVLQVAPVPAPRAKDPAYLRTLRDQAAVWGADEVAERAVLYRLGRATYMGGATFLRYGRTWHIQSLASALFGTAPTGRAQPTSPAAFRAAVAGAGG
jgi:hypothetical protein